MQFHLSILGVLHLESALFLSHFIYILGNPTLSSDYSDHRWLSSHFLQPLSPRPMGVSLTPYWLMYRDLMFNDQPCELIPPHKIVLLLSFLLPHLVMWQRDLQVTPASHHIQSVPNPWPFQLWNGSWAHPIVSTSHCHHHYFYHHQLFPRVIPPAF